MVAVGPRQMICEAIGEEEDGIGDDDVEVDGTEEVDDHNSVSSALEERRDLEDGDAAGSGKLAQRDLHEEERNAAEEEHQQVRNQKST